MSSVGQSKHCDPPLTIVSLGTTHLRSRDTSHGLFHPLDTIICAATQMAILTPLLRSSTKRGHGDAEYQMSLAACSSAISLSVSKCHRDSHGHEVVKYKYKGPLEIV